MPRSLSTVLLLSMILVAAGSAGCQTPHSDGGSASAVTTATPGKFTAGDIAKLKWLEGTWRGTGENQPPFFERYSFDGSTMIVESLADETLQKVNETSRYELTDGEFGHTDGGSRSAASNITDNAVQFVPVSGAKNSFRFERQGNDSWQATIEWPAADNKPARKIVYKMERWPKR